MDWISALVSAIASVRLILIFSGMLMLVRCITRTGSLLDNQKMCFALSGVIYLLGLMPQSLLLLLTNSDVVTHMLDGGYLCWIQKFACIVAVALQCLIFLGWILTLLRSYYSTNSNNSFLKRKEFVHVSILYAIFLIVCRLFFLKIDDSKMFYTDVATGKESSHAECAFSTVQKPVQVIRLQLLLCESSLSASDMNHFLAVCYLLLVLPLVFVCFITKSIISRKTPSSNADKICLTENSEGWQHHTWWEQDVNIQKILSAAITLWYFVLQPAVFALNRQHFVDFGTHLLLTTSVFIPWTMSSTDHKSVQSWV